MVNFFHHRYSKIALDRTLIPERKRIDFVLIHNSVYSKDTNDPEKKKELERHERNRERFKSLLEKEGFSIQSDTVGEHVYIKLHCPFKRLCVEAEKVRLEMPLKDMTIPEGKPMNFLDKFVDRHLDTDKDVLDYVSSQFIMNKVHLYEGWEDPTHFFRPSIRSFLVHHILINLDIRSDQEKEADAAAEESEDEEDQGACSFCPGPCRTILCCGTNGRPTQGPGQQPNSTALKKKGLKFLLMRGTYTDFLVLHEDSVKSHEKEDNLPNHFDTAQTQVNSLDEDPRKDLDDSWTKPLKFQPMWHIRDYFGEKIAFYFAWTGMLITTLWIPTFFGLIVFFYGLYQSVTENTVTNSTGVAGALKDVLGDVKRAFDNDITPFFALFICCWGTIFLELWKRQRATLAYEWDVDQFEANEPDRPQFYGTKIKQDPVTNEAAWFYPFRRQILKFTTSGSVLFFMTALVIISVVAVIVYRVVMDVDYCPNMPDNECFLLTTVLSSIMNAVSILLLGKIYDKLAVVLTDWENHRTQTRYDDALIIKLFAFQFVNSYASCFYIAFFRGRGASIFNDRYVDSCEGSCMTQLSFQVLTLMVAKPFPKFFKDIIIPFLLKLWRKRPNCCRCRCCPCCRPNQVEEMDGENVDKCKHSSHLGFLERERLKPDLGDFTLGEYTEKVILYGFLMLFASSFPLAPLLALVICYVDIRVDAKRMLWWYRRPIAFVAEDIGMWHDILNLVNFIGVITNAFIIAFTSNWGSQFDTAGKLWVVVGFEHIVFALKFVLAYMIPDVPQPVKLAIRREKYLIQKTFEDKPKDVDYSHLFPTGISAKDTITEEDTDDVEVKRAEPSSKPVTGKKSE
ncbi:anoctamin-5 [Aplysia californica]|uniref:Anoctamin n=1 Tax=Aplysia californica TaxID=6500 RepID=A0ABM1AAX8_APLCA|nr:anoctamin-5 [Aplysia californica]